MKQRRQAALLAFVVTAAFCGDAAAGRDPEEWDDLPQVQALVFSKASIGIRAGEWYILDRKTGRLETVSEQRFAQEFRGSPIPPVAVTVNDTGINSTVVLRASNGVELTTQDAYCAEGDDTKHQLSMNGRPLADHVDPCTSISAVEVVGNQLWLGTRRDGEYGDYPAEGVVVQAMGSGGFLAQLGTGNGLTGNLIRAIRSDPVDGSVWIATNEGLNQVDRQFRVLKSLYFQRAMDPKTGATVRLTPKKQGSNPLATVLRGLKVVDGKRFYEAVSSIPPALQQRGFSGANPDPDAPELERVFAMPAMNVLVPFFIEAARSADEEARQYALSSLLWFNDPRVTAFLIEKSKALAVTPDAWEAITVRQNLVKLMKYRLIDPAGMKDLREATLQQQVAALRRIRAQQHYGKDEDLREFARTAKSLLEMGDLRGIDLINEHFRTSGDSRRDSGLYEAVGQELVYEDGIIPAMLEGLRKISSSNVSRGCQYFDLRWHNTPSRANALHAEAILTAMEHRAAQRFPTRDTSCGPAFKSQLANEEVREDFFDDIYPRLNPQQKALADRLGSEAPAPGQ